MEMNSVGPQPLGHAHELVSVGHGKEPHMTSPPPPLLMGTKQDGLFLLRGAGPKGHQSPGRSAGRRARMPTQDCLQSPQRPAMDGGPSSFTRGTCCRLPPLPGLPGPSSWIDRWHGTSLKSLALRTAARASACTGSSREPSAPSWGDGYSQGSGDVLHEGPPPSDRGETGLARQAPHILLDTSWTRLGSLSSPGTPQRRPRAHFGAAPKPTCSQPLTLFTDILQGSPVLSTTRLGLLWPTPWLSPHVASCLFTAHPTPTHRPPHPSLESQPGLLQPPHTGLTTQAPRIDSVLTPP